MGDMINREHAIFINWIPPLLEVLKEKGGSATAKEVCDGVAKRMKLNDDILSERYEKSGHLKFKNQVYWAKQYLAWEKLVGVSKHGVWALTEEGWNTSLNYDEAFALFSKWVKIHYDARKKQGQENKPLDHEIDEDVMDSETEETLSLLEILKQTTPTGFEHLCGRLLREYNFETIEITKRSHDGGIDGTAVLKLNPFVKTSVYFQCKKYDGAVPIGHVREFLGVLATDRRGVDKGLFITTGTFPPSAYALERNNTNLELVDGEKLVDMFEKAELGVTPRIVYDPDPIFFKQYIDETER